MPSSTSRAAQIVPIASARPTILSSAKKTDLLPHWSEYPGDVIAANELLRRYMEPAVAAIAERVEKDLLALYAAFGQGPGVSGEK